MRRITIAAAVLALAAGRASADPFDPTKFASLGGLTASPTSATAWTINTGNGISTPTLTEGTGGTVLFGVLTGQPGGGPAVAVFDFDSINLSGPLTITATGTLPLALLSRGDATIGAGTTVSLDGGVGSVLGGGVGGAGGGSGGFTGTGTGPGGGGGGFGSGGGGGFGGGGGSGGFGGAGGSAYGDLTTALVGGSGGGGGTVLGSSYGGGGGGGAIELAAIGTISITGTLSANGGAGTSLGGNGENLGFGGGSGGAIYLAADSVNIPGSLSAAGGVGGAASSAGAGFPFGGGGGGGGRILIETGPGGLNLRTLDYSGGAGGATFGTGGSPGFAGSVGLLTVLPFPTDPVGPQPVPEPSSVALLGLGAAGLALLGRRRRAVAG